VKKSRSRVGYRAGAGIEIMVSPTIGVGGDYIYTFYQNVKASGSTGGRDVTCDVLEGCVSVPATFSTSSRASRFSDQQLVGQMIYHFG
jgi:opacity protein-like surface antigen